MHSFDYFGFGEILMKKLLLSTVVGSTLLAVVGCQSMQTEPVVEKTEAALSKAKAVVVGSSNNNDLYEVKHEGRYYVFDDFATYQSFLDVGETSYRKVFIGGGPKGETLVFGLTGKDKKKLKGIAGVDMYNGDLAAAEDFYGEMRGEDGRLYVFNRYEDMVDLRQIGEAPYRFTQIGSGPQGQTVVFVLNKTNKKQHPVALIQKFKTMNKL